MSEKLYDIPRQALVFGASDTTKSFVIRGTSATYQVHRGKALKTIIETPNWNVSAEYEVKDPNGNRLFHADNLAGNQTGPPITIPNEDPNGVAYPGSEYPVFEGCTVSMTLSAAPGGAGGTGYVTIYYK